MKSTLQTIKLLPVGELLTGGYQRPTNTTQVDKIVAGLCATTIGDWPLTVKNAWLWKVYDENRD